MAAISHHSPGDTSLASSSAQSPVQERTPSLQARVVPWGPALQLSNDDIYPILEKTWEKNLDLGSTFREGSSPKRLRTEDIDTAQVPLPPCVNFVPVGVVGGMGPEATLDLTHKLFKTAKEVGDPKSDQDHMQVITMNIPNLIKDRTAYLNSFTGDRSNPDEWRAHLLKNDPNNPYHGSLAVAQACVAAGAHFLIFPCNTFHAYHGVLSEKLKVPLLHIAEATMWALRKHNLDPDKSVGLLATSGTIDSKLYQTTATRMEQYGCPRIKWALPSPTSQKEHVMAGIYEGVKFGDMEKGTELLDQAVQELTKDHALSAVVEGCTEIPLALKDKDYGDIKLIDPTQSLAEMAVEFSRNLARLETKFAR
ncbi:aspartate/glutamate racemase family protein [Herbaspirillum rubrisubalbicans]|uniref:aspartate/glutamate racemase family protein n=1 Tax=Herbaspirillum rubrisubalbicans TaxID=80842 RepID=UPI0021600375|nr:amino acid racemase [Herbaspirillum rubrisubalbicans]